MTDMLRLEEASVTVHDGIADRTILFPISLDFPRGLLSLVLGPSGSGKTTLLSLAGGLLAPSTGRVMVGEQSLYHWNESRRAAFRLAHIGFVFQSSRLLRGLTVEENVSLPLRLQGTGQAEARRRACEVLSQLGLESRLTDRPFRLSGGEAQRVTLARAMVTRPAIVLADEPTASVDHSSAEMIANWLQRVAREEGAVVICATHDPRLMPAADRVIQMKEGELEEQG